MILFTCIFIISIPLYHYHLLVLFCLASKSSSLSTYYDTSNSGINMHDILSSVLSQRNFNNPTEKESFTGKTKFWFSCEATSFLGNKSFYLVIITHLFVVTLLSLSFYLLV